MSKPNISESADRLTGVETFNPRFSAETNERRTLVHVSLRYVLIAVFALIVVGGIVVLQFTVFENQGSTATDSPTSLMTIFPTINPTVPPTESPSESPTETPTQTPTDFPTKNPTDSPTKNPSLSPSESPTLAPNVNPTELPTQPPTQLPTTSPTLAPTRSPITPDFCSAFGISDEEARVQIGNAAEKRFNALSITTSNLCFPSNSGKFISKDITESPEVSIVSIELISDGSQNETKIHQDAFIDINQTNKRIFRIFTTQFNIEIKGFPNNLFDGFTDLQEVALDRMRFTQLDNDIFGSASGSITQLLIRSNLDLTSIPGTARFLPNLLGLVLDRASSLTSTNSELLNGQLNSLIFLGIQDTPLADVDAALIRADLGLGSRVRIE